jgi:hypothetical protein
MLFDRVVKLNVGNTKIRNLDIAFEIQKDELPEPNPCHVDIYNLGPENRATLSRYAIVPVVLKAGYKDNVGIIFKGNMVRCVNVFENASWKTTLSCGDGAEVQGKRTQQTYAKGTPLEQVIKDLSKVAGLSSNDGLSELQALNKMLSRPLSISGNPMAEMTRILSSQSIRASIQNNALQLRPFDQPLSKEALDSGDESELLASPEISSKGKVLVRTLLKADYSPGRLLHLRSRMLNGTVVIEKVRFSGSNFADTWEAELECVLPK